jgi:GAF domain-containing protein/PAS domain-containing protein
MRRSFMPGYHGRGLNPAEWRQWLETDTGILTLIWYVRFGILLWLALFYLIRGRSLFSGLAFPLLLIGFFVYVVASGVLGLRNPTLFADRRIKLIQTVTEIAFYLGFYYLTGDPRSGMYFLLFAPLFVAVRFLPLTWSLGVLLFTMAGLAVVEIALSPGFAMWDMFSMTAPREMFLVAMTAFYLARRRADVLAEVSEDDSPLRTAFGSFADGVYVTDRQKRLLFVNDVLESRHGPYTPFQSCASYLTCEDRQCGIDFTGGVDDLSAKSQKREASFTDRWGHRYEVEISSSLLPAEETSGYSGAISLVRDLSEQRAFEQQLKDRAESLESERAKLLQTCYEMSQLLTGEADLPRLMQFVVDETRARLNAEASALFLLENGRLVRKATSGVENEWFPGESFQPGEGLTGLALIPVDGSPFGRPIRANDVDRNPYVVPLHLQEYREKLATGCVRHLIAVPLNGRSSATGVLRVVNRLSAPGVIADKGFRREDEEFLVILASMVAVALENTRLLAEATARLKDVSTLNKIGQHIAAAQEQDELLRVIAEEAVGNLPAARKAGIQLIDEQTGVLQRRAEARRVGASRGLPPLTQWEGIAGRAIRNRRLEYVRDVLEDPDFVDRGDGIRTLVVAPLIAGDRVIGVLSVDGGAPGSFNEGDIGLLTALADQAAIAIEKSEFAEQLRQRAHEIQQLYDASQAVTSSLQIDEVMERVMRFAREVAGSDYTAVLLRDDRGVLVSHEDADWLQPLANRARPGGITEQILESGQPILFDSVDPDDGSHNPAIRAMGVHSYAGIPIGSPGKVQGVVFVHSYHEDAFRARLPLLRTFCNQAAVAVENAHLFSAETLEAELLARLSQHSSTLIAHTGLQDLLDACVQGAAAVFGVEDCSLSLLNQERATVDLVASSGVPPHVWTGREAEVTGPGLTAHTLRSGETLNFGGVEYRDHPAWGGRTGKPFTAHLDYLPSRRCHSLLLTPIINAQGQRIGVLKLENRRGPGAEQRFSDFETAMFKTYASHVGLAIERARLFAQLDQEAERKARASIGDEIHEILNLVQGLVLVKTGIAQALLERGDTAGAREQLEMIAKGALSIKAGLRSTYMDVQRSIPAESLLSALQRSAESLGLKLAISVQGREPFPHTVEYALYKIGQETLSNIHRHAGLGTDDHVELMLSRASGGYEMRITDPGRGFDVETVRNLPDSFGLQGMERRSRSIGAHLEIESWPGKGTCVRVFGRLPCSGERRTNGRQDQRADRRRSRA